MKQGNAMSGKLNLKNKHDREAWLLHLLDGDPEPYIDLSEELGVKIYRYNFENGASLIITCCCALHYVAGVSRFKFYDLLTSEQQNGWFMNASSECQVVDWMTSHAREL